MDTAARGTPTRHRSRRLKLRMITFMQKGALWAPFFFLIPNLRHEESAVDLNHLAMDKRRLIAG